MPLSAGVSDKEYLWIFILSIRFLGELEPNIFAKLALRQKLQSCVAGSQMGQLHSCLNSLVLQDTQRPHRTLPEALHERDAALALKTES